MKSLIIIRHAKSDWEDPALPDYKRPLNARGHRDAKEMAERLVKRATIPDAIVTSTAVRALTTSAYFSEILDLGEDRITFEPRIYEASLSTLLALVGEFNDTYHTIALFGHNPGLSYLAEALTGQSIGNLPTCSAVFITFPFNSWKMVSKGTGDLILLDYPKKPFP